MHPTSRVAKELRAHCEPQWAVYLRRIMRTMAVWAGVFGVGMLAGCGETRSDRPAFEAAVGFAADPAAAPDRQPPSVVPHPRMDVHSIERRGQIRMRAERGDAEIVLLGDSITEGWRGPGSGVLARVIESGRVANLGIAGDRTDDVLGRVASDLEGFDPSLVILLIGTNNLTRDPAEDVVAGVREVAAAVHGLRPEAEILLVALLPRGFEVDSAARRAVMQVNALLERAARDWPVTYLDVGDAILEPGGALLPAVSPDGLHLTPLGYARWWEAMQPSVHALLERARAR